MLRKIYVPNCKCESRFKFIDFASQSIRTESGSKMVSPRNDSEIVVNKNIDAIYNSFCHLETQFATLINRSGYIN